MSIITAAVLVYFACKIGNVIREINSGPPPTPEQVKRFNAELKEITGK